MSEYSDFVRKEAPYVAREFPRLTGSDRRREIDARWRKHRATGFEYRLGDMVKYNEDDETGLTREYALYHRERIGGEYSRKGRAVPIGILAVHSRARAVTPEAAHQTEENVGVVLLCSDSSTHTVRLSAAPYVAPHRVVVNGTQTTTLHL